MVVIEVLVVNGHIDYAVIDSYELLKARAAQIGMSQFCTNRRESKHQWESKLKCSVSGQ